MTILKKEMKIGVGLLTKQLEKGSGFQFQTKRHCRTVTTPCFSAMVAFGVTTYYKSYDTNGKVEEEYKDGNKIDYRTK